MSEEDKVTVSIFEGPRLRSMSREYSWCNRRGWINVETGIPKSEEGNLERYVALLEAKVTELTQRVERLEGRHSW